MTDVDASLRAGYPRITLMPPLASSAHPSFPSGVLRLMWGPGAVPMKKCGLPLSSRRLSGVNSVFVEACPTTTDTMAMNSRNGKADFTDMLRNCYEQQVLTCLLVNAPLVAEPAESLRSKVRGQ